MPWEEILGSRKVLDQLARLANKQSFPPLIFWGRPGIGKRTTALVFAQSLNCERGSACGICRSCIGTAKLIHPDVWVLFPTMKQKEGGEESEKEADEVHAKHEEAYAKLRRDYSLHHKRPLIPKNYSIHIEDIRRLSQEMRFQPLTAKKRVVIIVDADRMLLEASNAFLKTLEEPQKDTVFILLTSRLSFIPSTIRSRCFPIYFPPLKDEAILGYLVKLGYDEGLVKRALVFAYGSLRRAMDFLDNPFPVSEDFFSVLLSPRWSAILSLIEEMRSTDLEGLIENLILLFHSQLLKKFALRDYDSFYPEVLTVDELLVRIERLFLLAGDLEYNLNRRLFLFNLLLTIRRRLKPKRED